MQLSLRRALDTDFAFCESLTRSSMSAYHSARGNAWDAQRFITHWGLFENSMILADDQVMSEANRRGLGLLRLRVFRENPAMQLYARLGFKIDATHDNGKVHMSYALAPLG